MESTMKWAEMVDENTASLKMPRLLFPAVAYFFNIALWAWVDPKWKVIKPPKWQPAPFPCLFSLAYINTDGTCVHMFLQIPLLCSQRESTHKPGRRASEEPSCCIVFLSSPCLSQRCQVLQSPRSTPSAWAKAPTSLLLSSLALPQRSWFLGSHTYTITSLPSQILGSSN